MQIQTSLFGNIAPVKVLSKKEITKLDNDRRLKIAAEAFDHQTEIFKEKFESFLVRFLDTHIGQTIIFPDVTIAYGKRSDLPQPRVDFRCVGHLTRKYKKLGRLRKLRTTTDPTSGRDIPVYQVLSQSSYP